MEKNAAKSRNIFSLIIFIFITLVVTSFDYLWYGPLPLWLILALCCFFLIVVSSQRFSTLKLFLHNYFGFVVAPILGFIVAVALVSVLKNNIEVTASRHVFLNFTVLFMMIVIGSLSALVKWRTLIYVIAIIALLQGCICIAQYLGISAAWDFSISVIDITGADSDVVEKELQLQNYDAVGRVKGAHLYVHKFTPMQGMLTTFLVTILIISFQSGNPIKLNLSFVLFASILAFLGMILTFSRSVFVGFLLSIFFVFLSIRRISFVFYFLVFGVLLLILASLLGIQDAAQFGRLDDYSADRATNSARLEHLNYSLDAFFSNPLVGGGHLADAGHLRAGVIHSTLLRVLVDYGLFGLFFYLLVLYGILRAFWLARLGCEAKKIISIGCLGAFGVSLLDAWTHSSGFLVTDVSVGAILGIFLGALLRNE